MSAFPQWSVTCDSIDSPSIEPSPQCVQVATTLGDAETMREARAAAADQGWLIGTGRNGPDYCPACQPAPPVSEGGDL